MRHALILSIALTALAGAAEAQSRPPADGQAAGLRYLTWAGKAEAAAPVRDALAPSPSPLRPAMARNAPPRVIPHAGGMASAPAPTPAPRGLTPANAWIRPAAAAPPPPVEAPPPAPLPAPPARPEPAPVQPSAASATADPMAPRRDAAIFRMGSQAAATADAPAPAPVQQAAAPSYAPGGRYYSVHRQNGRHPDAVAMPAPVYLDALPVELDRAPQSEDLAAPPAAPTVLRDANGRIRPAPPATGDDIQ